ncbi:MAG: glycoside hydrolase family 113 [Patescibacteria group bacterium]
MYKYVVALAILFVFTAPALGQGSAQTGRDEVNTRFSEALFEAPQTAATTAAEPEIRLWEKLRFFSLPAWWVSDYDDVEALQGIFLQASSAGFTGVELTVSLRVQDLSTPRVFTNDSTVSMSGLENAISLAHAAGLAVHLKVHLNSETGEWTAHLGQSWDDAQWAQFESTYRAAVGPYIDLARELGVEWLVWGNELENFTRLSPSRFMSTAAWAKSRFGGRTTSYASHMGSEITAVPWGQPGFDIMVVNAWYRMCPDGTPRDQAFYETVWRDTIIPHIQAARSAEVEVFFAEVGYRSISTGCYNPWDWSTPGTPDQAEQAELWRAFVATMFREPWFLGFSVWDVQVKDNPTQPWETNYSPFGKEAEGVFHALRDEAEAARQEYIDSLPHRVYLPLLVR